MRSRFGASSWLLALAALTFVGSARAAPADGRAKSVAVLEVKCVGTFDPQAVAGLSSFIASEALESGLKVVAGSDLVTVLGVQRQRALLGCSDTACLAEIGGALGVDYLLAPEISEIGGVWLLTLALLDTRKGTALSRVTGQADQQRGLVGLVPGKVAEVLLPLSGRPERVAPQATALEARVDGTRSFRPLGITLDAAAVALALGGAAFHYSSLQAWDRARALRDEGTDYEAFVAEKRTSDQRMIGAGVLYAAGAVALGTGLYLTLRDEPEQVLLAAPTDGGGVLMVWRSF